MFINQIFAIGFLCTFVSSIICMLLGVFVCKDEKLMNIAYKLMMVTAVLFFSLAVISGIHQYMELHCK